MRAWTPFILVSGLVCVASTPTVAASLQVSPTLFELSAAKAADVLTLHGDETKTINAQIRVYRWSQSATGEEKTEQATDVVASPPVVSLRPGTDQIVRLVRTSKQPVAGEEAYRVMVEEIPNQANLKVGEIGFVVKHSIPLFVTAQPGGKSQLTWGIETQGDKKFITAKNGGNRRARIGGLTLRAPGAKDFVLGKGLNGYVLSGSSMRWALPNTVSFGNTGPVSVTARSDEGPINATAQAQDSVRR